MCGIDRYKQLIDIGNLFAANIRPSIRLMIGPWSPNGIRHRAVSCDSVEMPCLAVGHPKTNAMYPNCLDILGHVLWIWRKSAIFNGIFCAFHLNSFFSHVCVKWNWIRCLDATYDYLNKQDRRNDVLDWSSHLCHLFVKWNPLRRECIALFGRRIPPNDRNICVCTNMVQYGQLNEGDSQRKSKAIGLHCKIYILFSSNTHCLTFLQSHVVENVHLEWTTQAFVLFFDKNCQAITTSFSYSTEMTQNSYATILVERSTILS